MDKSSVNEELTPQQKRRLLNIGIEPESAEVVPDEEEKRADTLYDILTRPLPVDKLVLDSLPTVLKNLCQKLRSVAGEPVGQLLQNPKTDISAIRGIKEYAKQSGTLSGSELEGDAYLSIYYAAIASALVLHNEKISQHSYEDLEQFFGLFAKKSWMPDELITLFVRAEEYCRKKLLEK